MFDLVSLCLDATVFLLISELAMKRIKEVENEFFFNMKFDLFSWPIDQQLLFFFFTSFYIFTSTTLHWALKTRWHIYKSDAVMKPLYQQWQYLTGTRKEPVPVAVVNCHIMNSVFWLALDIIYLRCPWSCSHFSNDEHKHRLGP